MGRINTMVGITNATVNIDKSVKQFYKYIMKRCNVNVGKPLPVSVCIGTRRLEVLMEEENRVLVRVSGVYLLFLSI